jgi:hypothetical protein
MRTKVLLCAAALAASLATSMAQSNVYSLNVVGYYNITVGALQQVMIANQLNTTNNTLGSLLAPPMVNNNDILYKYSGGFSLSQYSTDDGQWDPSPAVTLNPGEAAFFKNEQSAITETLTFVGEVLQGSLTNTLPINIQVMRSSIVPQQGLVSTTLGLPFDNNDLLYVYNVLQNHGSYTLYQYSTDDGQWDPNEPTINVGQGFFYKKAATALPANANWVRNFTVQ